MNPDHEERVMGNTGESRRAFFKTAGAAVFLAACRPEEHDLVDPAGASMSPAPEPKASDEVASEDMTAVEDLLREHGILRRALVVYREVAARLHERRDVAGDLIQGSAKLVREFGEDYHERKMEEAYVFPDVKRYGGDAAPLVDVLIAQHERGRLLTDWIISVTQSSKNGARVEELAKVLNDFALMYEAHAAWEDTVLFPAWKKAISQQLLRERRSRFEEIEYEQLGAPGFEDACLQKIADIETSLGIGDLAQLTAPAPRSKLSSAPP